MIRNIVSKLTKGALAAATLALAACGGGSGGGGGSGSDGSTSSDLVVKSMSVGDAIWSDSGSTSVTLSIWNKGTGTAPASTAGIFISTDSTISVTDTLIGTEAIVELPSGFYQTRAHSVSIDLSAFGLAAGNYYVGVIPDYGSLISETNETNNGSTAGEFSARVGLSSGRTADDTNYTGRWGWRGDGADGPRGVVVTPWGTPSTVASFETSESYRMGWNPIRETTSRNWGQIWDDGDPIGDIGARDAYALGLDGSGVVVAVIDGHIDDTHVDLDGNFLKHYDASGVGVVAADNYGDHGTNVAGIIAAELDGQGTHGVAHGASLIGISFQENANGSLNVNADDLASAITSAVNDGARIFNNSWGSGTYTNGSSSLLDYSVLRQSVADAIDEGAVFIWAAGNSYSANTGLGDYNTSEEAKAALEYAELAGGFVNVVNLDWDPNTDEWTIANSLGSNTT